MKPTGRKSGNGNQASPAAGKQAPVLGEDRGVGFGEIVLLRLVDGYPAELFMVAGERFAVGEAAAEGDEAEAAFGIAVFDGGEAFDDLDPDPELLVEFTVQGVGFGLTRLRLAAGELPLPFEMAPFGPAGDQEPPVAFDDGADDVADVDGVAHCFVRDGVAKGKDGGIMREGTR